MCIRDRYYPVGQQHGRLILRLLSCDELNVRPMFAGQLGSIIKELPLIESNAHDSPIDSTIDHLVSVSFQEVASFPWFCAYVRLAIRDFL